MLGRDYGKGVTRVCREGTGPGALRLAHPVHGLPVGPQRPFGVAGRPLRITDGGNELLVCQAAGRIRSTAKIMRRSGGGEELVQRTLCCVSPLDRGERPVQEAARLRGIKMAREMSELAVPARGHRNGGASAHL